MCFSIAFGCRRVNFYCHCTVSKCVILLYYVQKLLNQINKLTAIYVLLNRYTEKIFGKLGSLPALYYTWQVIYRRIFFFLNVKKKAWNLHLLQKNNSYRLLFNLAAQSNVVINTKIIKIILLKSRTNDISWDKWNLIRPVIHSRLL